MITHVSSSIEILYAAISQPGMTFIHEGLVSQGTEKSATVMCMYVARSSFWKP